MPSANLRGTCFLPEYDLRFHKVSTNDGSGKCNIVPGTRGIFVAIFDIEVTDRPVLDKIEGLGIGYNHERIQTAEFGPCLTYIAEPGAIDSSLRPFDWYKEYVLRGARFHGFPADYIADLQDIAADVDTHESRAGREWSVVEALECGA